MLNAQLGKSADETSAALADEVLPANLVTTVPLESEVYTLEQHDAWYKQAVQSTVDLDQLFVPVCSTVSDAPLSQESTTYQIQACLKAKYRTAKMIEQPGKPHGVPIDTTFINLALIQEFSTSTTSTPPTYPNHVIVIGEAGVGKSVLSQYLTYCWSEKNLWGGSDGQFKAVFWLRLKDILFYTTRESPQQLLIDKCMQPAELGSTPLPTAETLKDWLHAHSSEVVFIADGYDEVAELDSSHPSLTLLLQYLMTFPNVLLTSRPYRYQQVAAIPFQEAFSRHYRNVGFKDQDIERYIAGYFNDEAEHIILQENLLYWLKQYPIAHSIAHVPLQLGMLCSIWKDHQGPGLNNPTLSRLYETIKKDRIKKCKFTLEQTQRSEIVLMLLAYLGMNNSQYRFTATDIEDRLKPILAKHPNCTAESLFKETLDLGFLKSTHGLQPLLKAGEIYYFVHLTYQEEYAACYITHLFETMAERKSIEEIDQLMTNYKFSERYQRVWWFVAGLLGIKYQEARHSAEINLAMPTNEIHVNIKKAKDALVYFFDALQQSQRDILGGYDLALLTRCLEESAVDITEFCPELTSRLQAGLRILRRAVVNLPGITKTTINQIPLLLQLQISPQVQLNIGDDNGNWQACIIEREDIIDQYIQDLLKRLNTIDEDVIMATANVLGLIYTIFTETYKERIIQGLLLNLKQNPKHLFPHFTHPYFVRILYDSHSIEEDQNDFYPHRSRQIVYYYSTTPLGSIHFLLSHAHKELIVQGLLPALNTYADDTKHAVLTALHFFYPILSDAHKELVIQGLLQDFSSYTENSTRSLYGRISESAQILLRSFYPILSDSHKELIFQSLLQSKIFLDYFYPVLSDSHKKHVIQDLLLHYLEDTLDQYKCQAIVDDLALVYPTFSQAQKKRITQYLFQPLKERSEPLSPIRAATLRFIYPELSDIEKEQVVEDLFRHLELGYDMYIIPSIFSFYSEFHKERVIQYILRDLKNNRYKNIINILESFYPLFSEAHKECVTQGLLQLLDNYEDTANIALSSIFSVLSEIHKKRVLQCLWQHFKDDPEYYAPFIPKKGITTNKILAFLFFEMPKEYLYLTQVFLPKLAATSIYVRRQANDFLQKIQQSLPLSSQTFSEFYKPLCLWLAHDNMDVRLSLTWHILQNISVYQNDFSCQCLIFLSKEITSDLPRLPEVNLERLTEFLTFTLSACDQPELSARLCFAITYVCYAHQAALTIEEEGYGAYFKIHYQNQSKVIRLKSEEKMVSVLASLRKVYCEKMPAFQHEQIFPEPQYLIKNQHLWRFFHVPSQLAETTHVSSFIACDEHVYVSSKQWRVGIGCKEKRDFNWKHPTRNFGHAFLILEGIDQYGRGLYFRYDLCINRSSDKLAYHVVSQAYPALANETEREITLHEEIQNKIITHYLSWTIDRETEAPLLIKALEADKDKDMTSYYVSLPSSQGDTSEQKINCLTWARDHIKAAIGKTYKGELDSGLAIPSLRVKKVEPSKDNTCRLS